MTADALHDRYDVGPRLGGGTSGEVYRGRDRHTGEPVAIKHFWRAGGGAGALREAAALLGLEHPHVVRCRDFLYLGAGELYLISDLVEGGDLRNWLERRSPVVADEALGVLDQLLDGLAALHARGLVHGDVKPENILVEEQDGGMAVRLGDLGSARLKDSGRREGMAGTPAYRAPECYEARLLEASDLYSAGVLLYEMLVGRRPFSGTPAALRRAHRLEAADLDPIAPPELQDFVRRLLDKDPSHRFGSSEEARRALAVLRNALGRARPKVSRRRSGVTQPPWRAGPGWRRAQWALPERRERSFLLHVGGRPHLAIEVRGVLEVWDALAGRPTGIALPQVGWAVQVAQADTLVYATPSRLMRWNLAAAREEVLVADVPRVQMVHAEVEGPGLLWSGSDQLHLRRPGGSTVSWPCRNFGWGTVARFMGGSTIGFATGPLRPIWIEAGEDGEVHARRKLPGPLVEATRGPGALLALVIGEQGGVTTWRGGPGRDWTPEFVLTDEPWTAGAAADRALWSLHRGGWLFRTPLDGSAAAWRVGEHATGLLVTPDERFVAIIEESGSTARLEVFETELQEAS